MKITVQLEAQLRQAASADVLSPELPEGSTVADALQSAAALSAPVKSRLFDEHNRVQRSVLVFVNDQPVSADAVEQRLLNEGDVILLLPAISGG
ncbi:MAG: MoaD/ThiS family protein [Planctomycetaceae bacterium]|nr:MoaD/ThiS family protein [Planctomycetaceae bacterium]